MEIVSNTLNPMELERVRAQIVAKGKHKNIFHGGENGTAYLRFLVNKSLNRKRWQVGSNNYDQCAFCKEPATQKHYMLQCWAMKSYTNEFFGQIRNMIKQLLPPKKHENIELANLRIFDLIRFLRNHNITQMLTEKKFFMLNTKITEGIRKLEQEFYELFSNDHFVNKG